MSKARTLNPYDMEERINKLEEEVTSNKAAIDGIVGGDATDFQAWANNNGVVVLSVFIPSLNKRIGIRRTADGTISSYVE